MIKVLQINAGSENFGGVSSMILNIYRTIDRTKIQFDFLTPNITTFEMYREEIREFGGHIFDFHINNNTLMGKLKFALRLRKFLKNHSYDIVHINSGCLSFNCISAITVKLFRKQKIIIHAHSNNYRSRWKRVVGIPLKCLMQKSSDTLVACSKTAAYNMFLSKTVNSGQVMIIKDGIFVDKYSFDPQKRDYIRCELHLNSLFVIGHVGRFAKEKNHEFLIDIFKDICQSNDKAVLLLVGQGDLESSIKEKARSLDLADKIIFLGQRDDTTDLYQAMDVFCFPSLSEGLGMALIEAQSSGLPCFISDKIPNEVDATNLIHRLSIQSGSDAWAQAILKMSSYKRKDYSQDLINEGYSIEATAQTITKLYEKLCNK